MKKLAFCATLVALATLLNLSPLRADDGCCADAGCDSGCDAGCCDSCGGGGWLFDSEATFLRYARADGVQNGANHVGFDYEFSPRMSVGYQNCEGAGLRVRYWSFEHTGEGAGTDAIVVDTFTLDAEWFTEVQLTCATSVEFSAGMRYVDFTEQLFFGAAGALTEDSSFAAPGGLLGVEVTQQTRLGELYAKARTSLFMSDKKILNGASPMNDVIHSISEIGVGYRISRELNSGAMVSLWSGFEWQKWDNFSVTQNLGGDEASDAGFAGFVIGTGLEY